VSARIDDCTRLRARATVHRGGAVDLNRSRQPESEVAPYPLGGRRRDVSSFALVREVFVTNTALSRRARTRRRRNAPPPLDPPPPLRITAPRVTRCGGNMPPASAPDNASNHFEGVSEQAHSFDGIDACRPNCRTARPGTKRRAQPPRVAHCFASSETPPPQSRNIDPEGRMISGKAVIY
jgi:hypothetical protein